MRNVCGTSYINNFFEVDDVFVSYEEKTVVESKGYVAVEGYRYGFNSMERDDEVKGRGNSYTTEFRQYDPRLGRWLSRDPLFKEFPWQSPYVAFDNNPILLVDPYGDSTWVTETDDGYTINTTIEFYGRGLYKKDGTERKGADATINAIKKDILEKWNNTEYLDKKIKVNLITIKSERGGTEESYDQIEVKRGSGRSSVYIKDKNGTEISTSITQQVSLIKEIRNGTNYYRVSGTFYKNVRTGTYAHEYGHMIGYWAEDYKEGEFDNHGNSIPTNEFTRGSIMYSPYGIPYRHNFQRIFDVNRPKKNE